MHLYGFVPVSATPAPDLRGVDDAAVRALASGAVAAWVSDARAERDAGTAALVGIRAHNDVLQSAIDAGVTPLPARYGQRFADDARCLASITPRAAAIEARLARLAGLVEMTILIAPSVKTRLRNVVPAAPALDTSAPGAGRRYLEALRARTTAVDETLRGSEEVADALAQAVGGYVAATAPVTQSRVPIRTLSHLVRRDDVAGYREAVAQTRHAGRFRVVVIGPRPPFSFSTLDDGPRRGTNLAD